MRERRRSMGTERAGLALTFVRMCTQSVPTRFPETHHRPGSPQSAESGESARTGNGTHASNAGGGTGSRAGLRSAASSTVSARDVQVRRGGAGRGGVSCKCQPITKPNQAKWACVVVWWGRERRQMGLGGLSGYAGRNRHRQTCAVCAVCVWVGVGVWVWVWVWVCGWVCGWQEVAIELRATVRKSHIHTARMPPITYSWPTAPRVALRTHPGLVSCKPHVQTHTYTHAMSIHAPSACPTHNHAHAAAPQHQRLVSGHLPRRPVASADTAGRDGRRRARIRVRAEGAGQGEWSCEVHSCTRIVLLRVLV